MGLTASGAWADLMPSWSLTNGDKRFSDFTCNITLSGVADPSLCSEITVLRANEPITGNLGIEFQGPIDAVSVGGVESFVDIQIGYTVTAPWASITDIHMFYNGTKIGSGHS